MKLVTEENQNEKFCDIFELMIHDYCNHCKALKTGKRKEDKYNNLRNKL